jgi:hypothetical protein
MLESSSLDGACVGRALKAMIPNANVAKLAEEPQPAPPGPSDPGVLWCGWVLQTWWIIPSVEETLVHCSGRSWCQILQDVKGPIPNFNHPTRWYFINQERTN